MCNPVSTAHPELLLAKGLWEGFQWEVVCNSIGYRCGYVRVPQGHPWHGKHYDDISPDVHGGLTFTEADTDCGKGGDDNAWWLGFDAAHYMDAADPELPGYTSHVDLGGTIRTTEYMIAECRKLAEQAADAKFA